MTKPLKTKPFAGSIFSKLRFLFSRKNKLFLIVILFLTAVFSAFETIAIMSVMPFITAASNPEYVLNSEYLSVVYKYFGFYSPPQFVIVFGLFLAFFYFFRQFYVYLYHYALSKYAYGKYHFFAFRLFSSYMRLPYEEFSAKNRGSMSNAIVQDAMIISSMLYGALFIFSETVVILFLYGLLLSTNVKMTVALTLVVVAQIFLQSGVIDRIIKGERAKRDNLKEKFLNNINASLSNFKLIKLLSSEGAITEEFRAASREYTNSTIKNNLFLSLPKGILETVGLMVLTLSVVYVLIRYEYAHHVVPIISMYILALYRILPSLPKMRSAYSEIVAGLGSIESIYADLSVTTEEEGEGEVSFESEIRLQKVSFSYDGRWNILYNLDFILKKGRKIAITGDGKSTLIDIIIGIRRPQSGEVYVGDTVLDEQNIRSWRQKIGYIPKEIHLSYDTVAKNIAFGRDIDKTRVAKILSDVDIAGLFNKKSGLDTMIGEGGMHLSGGQKWRIALARALYADPEIIVFEDDGTDSQSLKKTIDILFEIASDKTIIVLAEGEYVLSKCEAHYSVDSGKVLRVG